MKTLNINAAEWTPEAARAEIARLKMKRDAAVERLELINLRIAKFKLRYHRREGR